ncbi:hypothetical protein MMA231_02054 [Asticcacaulis sp. MM231]|uniref:alpha/beta fold hydrolase n=1 Tax=Asticcacaulis sp. MM231 TaxID=3157666 RepID=UPI0032D5733D
MFRIVCACLQIVLLFGLPTVSHAAEPLPLEAYFRPQNAVKLPDGRRFNIFCIGSGGPTALIDSSLSQWSLEWRDIQRDLAQVTRVCTFDRAGYGFSDPGPLPRDASAEVGNLENALKAAAIKPPYILVGHSLGGINMRLFAYKHTEDVAGILLVDPAIEHGDKRLPYPKSYHDENLSFYRGCLKQLEAGPLTPGFILPGAEDPCLPKRPHDLSKAVWSKLTEIYFSKSRFEVMLSETESKDETSSNDLDANRHSLGSIPLVILSSDKAHFTEDRPNGVDADTLYNAWISAHEDQARNSTQGKNVIVEGASHFIFEERPDALLDAFNEVVQQARASKMKP